MIEKEAKMKILLVVLFLLTSLFLISCNDNDRNCLTNKFVDLEVSTCPSETIIKSCNGWFCQNIDNPDESFSLSSRNFDCEVTDCNFLNCIELESDEVTDFTDITPTASNRFTTLLNFDENEDFDCGLTVP